MRMKCELTKRPLSCQELGAIEVVQLYLLVIRAKKCIDPNNIARKCTRRRELRQCKQPAEIRKHLSGDCSLQISDNLSFTSRKLAGITEPFNKKL